MAAAPPNRAKSETAQPKPRRFGRWFRFSLATMFVVLTVFCLLLGFYAERARRQSEAVALVMERGGTVVYDFQYSPDGVHGYNAASPCPKWLENIFGIHYFAGVSEVRLAGPNVSDGDLVRIGDLSDLRLLGLANCPVTSDGLANLRRLKRLEVFGMSGTKVDDEGLKHLAQLPLRFLWLHDLRIGGQGFAYLHPCVCLQEIRLSATDLDDNGLSQFPDFPNLERLDLSITKVTSAGLKHLVRYSALRSLNVSDTAIDDEGLEELSRHCELDTLHLYGTRVSETGVIRFAEVRQSTNLLLSSKDLPSGWMVRIKGSRPNLNIDMVD